LSWSKIRQNLPGGEGKKGVGIPSRSCPAYYRGHIRENRIGFNKAAGSPHEYEKRKPVFESSTPPLQEAKLSLKDYH
jgi:hypothetical protein